jgi:dTDP-L-rhamnose 4-epimerase
MSKVLVTGGAGFIGCALVSRLLEAGSEVVVTDVLHPQVHADLPRALPAAATLIPFDVTHRPPWDALLRMVRPDTIVHLAAETGTGQSLLEASRHAAVNVLGTTQMLDALARADHVPRHIVLTSSRAVYGEGEWEADGERYYPGVRSHGDMEAGRWDPPSPSGARGRAVPSRAGVTRPEPTSVYGATKLAQEHTCRAWASACGSALSVLRLQNVYGAGQSLINPYTGVLSLFARLCLESKACEIYEDGNIIRDFVYIDDVVEALKAAIDDPPERHRLLDIGSGEPTTILEAATILAELTGAPDPVVTGRFRDGDVRAASCGVGAAGATMAYHPTWKLRPGLQALVDWVRHEVTA